MTIDDAGGPRRGMPTPRSLLGNKDFLAGLMFLAVGALGLWISRDYAIGTAVRMGTGFVPRLLCWMLVALGFVVMVAGLRSGERLVAEAPFSLRPFLLIPGALVVFALTIERLGVLIAVGTLTLLGGLAYSGSRPLEVVATALVLVLFIWLVFVQALGLPIPVWPGG